MGGSGGSFVDVKPRALQDQIRRAELDIAQAEFGPRLTELLDSYLATINARDVETTRQRLGVIKDSLADVIEETFDLLFGGSVAKRTFVDGLSDIDTLVVLKDPDRGTGGPKQILRKVARILRAKLATTVSVTEGRIAVTVDYSDGMQIQLVPAVSVGGSLRVPGWSGNTWSRIDPKGFTRALTNRNQQCAGKLIPVVKLAKAINGTLPESRQLSGYHIESLAVAAFRSYEGPMVISKMLPYFFREVRTLVLTQMKDKTGQSVHVDEYLGAAHSVLRREVSHLFDRIGKRMENATIGHSTEQWKAFFEQ